MKIGLIADKFQGKVNSPYGGFNYVYELAHSLRAEGLDVTFFGYLPLPDSLLKSTKVVEIGSCQPAHPLVKVITNSFDLWRNKEQLKEMNILHTISMSSLPMSTHIARSNTLPKLVFDERNVLTNEFCLRQRNVFKRVLYALFPPDYVMFLDERSLVEYHQLFPGRACDYFPSPVDVNRFSPNAQRTSSSKDKVRLLFATYLTQSKGILDLVEAMESVWQVRPDVELMIAGDGPLRESLQSFLDESRVTFLGYIPYAQMNQIYAQTDVLVHPSYREGFSRTVLEAMASGLAVITTEAGGLCMLKDLGVAKIIKPGRPQVLSDAICEMASSSDLRHRYGKMGREYVVENHSWEKAVRGILNLYSELIQDNGD